jgi:hypothetical protein
MSLTVGVIPARGDVVHQKIVSPVDRRTVGVALYQARALSFKVLLQSGVAFGPQRYGSLYRLSEHRDFVDAVWSSSCSLAISAFKSTLCCCRHSPDTPVLSVDGGNMLVDHALR